MIKKDFTKVLKLKGAVIEGLLVVVILAILSSLGVGAYFIIFESSKNAILTTTSRSIYDTLVNISTKEKGLITMKESGLEINDLEVLKDKVNEQLNEDYKFLVYFPKTVKNHLIIFTDYDANDNSFNSFIFVNKDITNRYAKTNFIDKETTIIGY